MKLRAAVLAVKPLTVTPTDPPTVRAIAVVVSVPVVTQFAAVVHATASVVAVVATTFVALTFAVNEAGSKPAPVKVIGLVPAATVPLATA
jgi:hypothetical protein